jgi:sporulation protein YlmC with PRC-barrel domain
MRLELGSAVRCTDAPFGELADVVIDPLSRRVTHLVVQPHRHPAGARLVPVGQARDDGSAIALDYSVAEVEALPHGFRRSSAVTSADGHHVGHVDGLLVSADGTADIVLERGHLWGRREIVIPAASVAEVEDDAVSLSLTEDEVGALAARRVHRWF